LTETLSADADWEELFIDSTIVRTHQHAAGAQKNGGDKEYDSNDFVIVIERENAEAVIPPRCNRTVQRPVDWHRYKARNLIERFFNRLKQFPRLATRYDKLAHQFNVFLQLACSDILLL